MNDQSAMPRHKLEKQNLAMWFTMFPPLSKKPSAMEEQDHGPWGNATLGDSSTFVDPSGPLAINPYVTKQV
jgi:hypothetical protein